MTTTQDYIIGGGAEGKARLNVLAQVLEPFTKSLLEKNGLSPGKKLLDVGCGGGNVSRMAAQIVGNSGSVTAVDFDATIVELNRAEVPQLPQLHYQNISAYDITYSNEFDIAYSRFLLSHLTEPALALRNIVRSVRPGASVVIEDVQFGGHICYPSNNAFETYVAWYISLARKRGQQPEIGPSLMSLLHETGLQSINFDIIQPAYQEGDGKWMAYLTLARIKDGIIAEKIASEAEVNTMLEELKDFTNSKDSFMSLPRIFRAWGVK